ncbi:MAG TPA: Crp/Fnr family transcriptional regulator [Gemmatimonadaceae bacterium]|nr:Crp/Fnr family transcriptional regulator [Gemmatimonadaceae bacterium]
MLHGARTGSLITAYDQGAEENRFLRMLPASSYFRIRPYLEVISLPKGYVVWNVDDPIDCVYFPRRCVLSLLVQLTQRAPVEAATVGNEGLLGNSIVLGAERSPLLVMVQIPGETLRIGARLFQELTEDDASLRLLTLRYSHALFEQTAQSVACNRRHSTVQRCARWLLMTHDRAHSDDFALTHQFLAMMLGVRRASVTVAAGQLQRAKLIRYLYGRVVVENRPGLEEAACECYQVVQQRFQRLFATHEMNGGGTPALAIAGGDGHGNGR